ncbi:phenylalanine--tRNA ligase subunit alpha [Candidatus Shikimatogenerans bostrichidophilus]|uniref:phenylalanine--tRNA ligase subunit alpha n=1 Tax=Candidatus Shikimatogenerans bostrichidophilus TaxID=2943807 RepID=UPI0029669490
MMNLIKIIDKYIKKIKLKYKKKTLNDLEKINIKKKYLSKNGIINKLLINLKKIKDKKQTGIKINYLKSEILKIIKNKNKNKNNNIKIDYDFFYIKKKKYKLGAKNPIYLIKEKIKNLLLFLNFKFIDNKEIEYDWYNFTALNFTKYHPSRNMQDTYYITKNILLRTHTSSIQIRYMKKNKPPIKVFTFGKVYRNESISNSSFNMFHQIELLYINKNVSIIDLKNIILYLLKNLFYNKYKYRYRISYFPFTKPSFEIDLYYNKKWVEIMGCGLVNKKVLNNVNLNYNKYSGFALGLGIERIAMIIYKINDIREFFKNDIRFIKQFK